MTRFTVLAEHHPVTAAFFDQLRENDSFSEGIRGSCTVRRKNSVLLADFTIEPVTNHWLMYGFMVLASVVIASFFVESIFIAIGGFLGAALLIAWALSKSPFLYYAIIVYGLRKNGYTGTAKLRWSAQPEE